MPRFLDSNSPRISNLFNIKELKSLISNFYKEDEEPETPNPNLRRLKILQQNIEDVLTIIYEQEGAHLYNVDTTLNKWYNLEFSNKSVYMELGGGSCGASRILEYLEKKKIINRDHGFYRLKRKYRDFFDLLGVKKRIEWPNERLDYVTDWWIIDGSVGFEGWNQDGLWGGYLDLETGKATSHWFFDYKNQAFLQRDHIKFDRTLKQLIDEGMTFEEANRLHAEGFTWNPGYNHVSVENNENNGSSGSVAA